MKKIILIIILLITCSCSNTKSVSNEYIYYCNVLITQENKDIIDSLRLEKYFICDNLEKYLAYYSLNDLNISDIISEVNVGLTKEYYFDMISSDLSKNYLILVNKFNYLNESYIPNDLEEISLNHNAGANNLLRHEARINFESMCEDAFMQGLNIYSASAYRTYESQKLIYDYFLTHRGQVNADKISARAGNSEHQLGLAVDVNSIKKEFEETPEFNWLINNSYKYGFILRYPKDFEKITGYSYEPWHYRYVGLDVAKYIYENNITFDEYYAYFLN